MELLFFTATSNISLVYLKAPTRVTYTRRGGEQKLAEDGGIDPHALSNTQSLANSLGHPAESPSGKFCLADLLSTSESRRDQPKAGQATSSNHEG